MTLRTSLAQLRRASIALGVLKWRTRGRGFPTANGIFNSGASRTMQRRSGRIGVGGDGSLTNPTVTIDSIFFYGAGNAKFYLDSVSHNPAGYLAAALAIPGDYDRNGIVGPEDYAAWKNSFGQSVTPGSGADGNGDGQVDGGDYTIWRDNLGAGSGGGTASSDVTPLPEPASHLLAISLLLSALDRSLRKTKKKLRENR